MEHTLGVLEPTNQDKKLGEPKSLDPVIFSILITTPRPEQNKAAALLTVQLYQQPELKRENQRGKLQNPEYCIKNHPKLF